MFVDNDPLNNHDPIGLLSLSQTESKVGTNRPVGINANLTMGVMLCLLWKEGSFDENATSSSSSAKGIAQILDGTADDIQDRAGPVRLGISSDPYYTLAAGERLKDQRFDPDVSIYSAYVYLHDRTLANGGDWEAGVRAYGPGGDKVITCSKCCAIVDFDRT